MKTESRKLSNERPTNTIDGYLNIIKISMSEKILKNACLQMVTTNGCSFTLIDYSGFRKIIDPIFDGINKNATSRPIKINDQKIKDLIPAKAKKWKQSLNRNWRQNQCLSKSISWLAWTDQYCAIMFWWLKKEKLNCIHLRCGSWRTGIPPFILRGLFDKFWKYNISLNQILSVTTDYGANMVKMIDVIEMNLLNELGDEQKNYMLFVISFFHLVTVFLTTNYVIELRLFILNCEVGDFDSE